jgi:hypothetical protein
MIRLLPSFLPALVSCLFLVGCASTPSTSSVTTSAPSTKAAESKALEENVTSLHAYSIFGAEDPRLFDAKILDTYPQEFAKSYCADASREVCAKRFDRVVFNKLSELYFAADPRTVEKTCAAEPLICDDLVSLETLFRRLHNSSIETSRREKLNLIEDWRRGHLSDEELKSALHLDFKFENGKLVLNVPSA